MEFLFLIISLSFPSQLSHLTVHVPLHAIYISTIEINDLESTEPTTRIRVFSDDLHNAIKATNNGVINYSIDALCDNQSEITSYFSGHLHISVEGQDVTYEVNSCESVGDSHWLIFDLMELPKNRSSLRQTLTVQANYFMELFPTQSHMLTVKFGGKKTFHRLTKSEDTVRVEL